MTALAKKIAVSINNDGGADDIAEILEADLAPLRAQLTPMDCGHLKAEWVAQGTVEHRKIKPSGASTCEEWIQKGYCRRCAELVQAKEEYRIKLFNTTIFKNSDARLVQLQKDVVEACQRAVTQAFIDCDSWPRESNVTRLLEPLATDASLRKGK